MGLDGMEISPANKWILIRIFHNAFDIPIGGSFQGTVLSLLIIIIIIITIDSFVWLREDIKSKNMFSFVYPCPNFLALFH